MFWTLVELAVIAAIVLVFITEFFIPILFNRPLFGSFRKTKAAEPKMPSDLSSLSEKVERTQDKVDEVKEEVKEVRQEVDENFKTAEELKEKSDNLL